MTIDSKKRGGSGGGGSSVDRICLQSAPDTNFTVNAIDQALRAYNAQGTVGDKTSVHSIPFNGTLKDLQIENTFNTATLDYIFTCYINGVASAVTLTIVNGTPGLYDSGATSVSVNKGDELQFVMEGNAGAGTLAWGTPTVVLQAT
jgi:hypothetical protein